MKEFKEHTFVICAYKKSPYLEECIESLLAQTVSSNIMITTSTPNEQIENAANKYNLSLKINSNQPGITEDWNFAYRSCDTKYVTLVHQDDIYEKTYLENVIRYIEKDDKSLIVFTDYNELKKGRIIENNKLLFVKRVLLFPLKLSLFRKNIFVRRRILSLGNVICCPTVTYVKKNLPPVLFSYGFKSNIDWEAWEKISKLKGSFVYCPLPLVYHRIHEESATTATIQNNIRIEEDYAMFLKFWPKFLAKLIIKPYQKSEESNKS